MFWFFLGQAEQYYNMNVSYSSIFPISGIFPVYFIGNEVNQSILSTLVRIVDRLDSVHYDENWDMEDYDSYLNK